MQYASNDEVFLSKIVILVDYKWSKVSHFIFIEGWFYLAFYFIISIDSIFFSNDINFKWVALMFNVLLTSYELSMMLLVQGIIGYFSNMWKWFDFFGQCFLIMYYSYEILF
jgi:hypothetical protein